MAWTGYGLDWQWLRTGSLTGSLAKPRPTPRSLIDIIFIQFLISVKISLSEVYLASIGIIQVEIDHWRRIACSFASTTSSIIGSTSGLALGSIRGSREAESDIRRGFSGVEVDCWGD